MMANSGKETDAKIEQNTFQYLLDNKAAKHFRK